MTRIELASIALIVAALIAAVFLLFAAPFWPFPAVMTAVFTTSLALLGFQLPAGYSVGQFGFFLVFLIGIANAIGDWEVPEYVEPIVSPYIRVAIVCLLFLGFVLMFRRAQAEMRLRLRVALL